MKTTIDASNGARMQRPIDRATSSPFKTPPFRAAAARIPAGQCRGGDGDGRERADGRRDGHPTAERAGGVAHAAASSRTGAATNHVTGREGRAGRREEEALRGGVEDGNQRQRHDDDREVGAHREQVQRRRRADGRDRAGRHEVPARPARISMHVGSIITFNFTV